ncbi:MAG TPA: hypothetical protein PKI32_07305 [Opitutales bacterium]|nr:hypothetical protein [Opitutales bacterium]
MKNSLFLPLLFVAGAVLAAPPPANLVSYQKVKTIDTVNLLKNPTFDKDNADAWSLTHIPGVVEARILPDAGFSQRGLQIKRTDDKIYTIVSQKIDLKPGKRYVFGGKLRVTDSDGRSSGSMGVEGFANSTKFREGEHVFCQYLASSGNFDWKDVKHEFSTKNEDNIQYYFICYYLKDRCGTASYDDLFIREAGGEFFAGLLNPYSRIEGKDRTLFFTATANGEMNYESRAVPVIGALAEVKDASGKVVLTDFQPVKGGRFCIDGAKIDDGTFKIDVTILDTANTLIIGKIENLVLHVGTPKVKKPAKGAVDIDRYGRCIIDGKPFMPLGFYVGGIGRMYDVKYFADSPFNCILVYSGYEMGMKVDKTPDAPNKVLNALDVMEKNGLKVIFGVPFLFKGYDTNEAQKKAWGIAPDASSETFISRIADTIKQHPALLAWYITDELPPSRYKELISHRTILNAHDPYHPTCGVYFQLQELSAYSASQDVPTIDFYPIVGPRDNQKQSQKLIVDSMAQARRIWTHPETGEMPFWATPQAFSWVTNPDTAPDQFRFPTETEILAMSAMSAIGGAKGFVYYYYHCILYGIGNSLDEKCERFLPIWKDFCNVAAELKALEPFIMSTAPTPKVTVKNIKGETHARAFVDEQYGRIRVLIASVGPGQAEAEITVEDFKVPEFARDNVLRSKFAKTKRITNNTYLFKGMNVDCDILQRWPEYELDKPVILMEQERKRKEGKGK